MQRIETSLPGVCLIESKIFSDPRGFFLESYHQDRFYEIGIKGAFVQDNHSKSVKGTLRGLHYQLKFPQAKLCRVILGEVFDVVVDIRRGSPFFGKWFGILLSSENKRQIYIPRGFAHGFVVLSETADFFYKCDDYYHPEDERGIAWNDPEIGIQWGIEHPLLSAKDRQYLPLSRIKSDYLPEF